MNHSPIPTLVFAGSFAWLALSVVFALGFAWLLGKLNTPDPFGSCDPLSFAGLDE